MPNDSKTEREPQVRCDDGLCSLRQSGAGGALRCAIFAIEDACRQLDWHYRDLEPKLSDEEYLKKLEELSAARLAATDALRPLWKLCGA